MTAVVANDASGYLASVVSADDPTGLLGTTACPWLIAALPGQRINVTFFNFIGKLCHGAWFRPFFVYSFDIANSSSP